MVDPWLCVCELEISRTEVVTFGMTSAEVVVVFGVPEPDAFDCLDDVATRLSLKKLAYVEVNGEPLSAPPLIGREVLFAAEFGNESLAFFPLHQHAAGVFANQTAFGSGSRDVE